jgi:hypothetical protein
MRTSSFQGEYTAWARAAGRTRFGNVRKICRKPSLSFILPSKISREEKDIIDTTMGSKGKRWHCGG